MIEATTYLASVCADSLPRTLPRCRFPETRGALVCRPTDIAAPPRFEFALLSVCLGSQ